MGEPKWEKLESAIFRFENAGDQLIGTLEAVEAGLVYDNKVYKIKDEKGKTWTVFGTVVLESKLNQVSQGYKVKIEFTGTQPSKVRGQNDIKLFDVYVLNE